jgi:hypothetical protein
MPHLVTPDQARFEVRDGAPVVVLAVKPPPEVRHGDWSILNRFTLIVVDGPGDSGYMLPRLSPTGDIVPPEWDRAVEQAAGSHVTFGNDPNAPTVFAHSLL